MNVQGRGHYSQAQQELQMLDQEMTKNHKILLETIKKKNEEEKSSKSWGVAIKVFSWVTTFLMIIAGSTLIASGVGAVAGALLVAGGVISLASQVMEITGGWAAVLKHIPGQSAQERAAVLAWIQVSILVLSIVLSLSGVIYAGGAAFSQGSQLASALMGGTALMAEGVCHFGKGRADSAYYHALADVRKHEARGDELRYESSDLLEKVEESEHIIAKGWEIIHWLLKKRDDTNAAFKKGLSVKRVR